MSDPDDVDGEGGTSMRRRRLRILEMVRDQAFVSVGEVRDLFAVSEVTVRSDFQVLERQGKLRRVRGGVVPGELPNPRREPSFVESLGTLADEKAAIGTSAAALVVPGETLILDVGTTTTAVARALASREDLEDVVVFTNGITIALELEAAIPRIEVVVTGGTLRPLQHSLVDPMGGAVLEQVHVDTVFLGCNGVHPTSGITNINLPEAAMKRRMIRAARRRVVVADGSKLGVLSLAPLCGIDDVDLLITGSSADPDIIAALGDQGLQVEVVPVAASGR
jgi:DeoR family transcriptional regulator, aga operon transcriptional repressor